jgi:hypothetical protein
MIKTMDHGWHEFHALYESTDDVTEERGRDIEEVVKSFEKLKETGLVYD